MAATVAGATLSGKLMSTTAHYKIFPLVGLGVGAIAAAVAAWKIDSVSFATLNLLLVVVNFGVGAMLPVATVPCRTPCLPAIWAQRPRRRSFSGSSARR